MNILRQPKIGILFFAPGRNETLRVNGRAYLSNDPKLKELFIIKDKRPKVLIVVDIEEVYLHCPKALVRSDLWELGAQNKKDLPNVAYLFHQDQNQLA